LKPIHNPEAERALIASCILDPSKLDLLDVEPHHFRDIDYQKIWKAMLSLSSPDAVTVSASSGVDINKILEITMGDVKFWNVDEYAGIVKKEYFGRKGAEIGGSIVTDAYNGEDMSLKVAGYIKSLNELSTVEDTGRPLVKVISDAADLVLERIDMRARGEKVEIGFQTGIGYIDRNFKGLKKGWLVYDAGSPNVGKTKKATQISAVLAKQAPGCYIALEGDEEATAYRLLETKLGKSATDIEFGNVESSAVIKAIEEFEELDYDFFYTPRLSVHELRAYVAKQKAERDIGWIVIDYISLLTVPGIADKNERDEAMSAELRRITGEFNILTWGLDSIVKSGANKILSLEDIAGRFSKQHDSDITFGYSDYRAIKGICPEIDDPERKRNCRLLGVLKDRHRGNKGKIMALEQKHGLVVDFVEEDDVYIPDYIHD